MDTVIIVDLLKGVATPWPRLENDEYIMSTGSARPLEDAFRISQVDMVAGSPASTGWRRWTPTSCSPRSRSRR